MSITQVEYIWCNRCGGTVGVDLKCGGLPIHEQLARAKIAGWLLRPRPKGVRHFNNGPDYCSVCAEVLRKRGTGADHDSATDAGRR